MWLLWIIKSETRSLARIHPQLKPITTRRLLRTAIFSEQITICQVSRLACTMNEITDGRVVQTRRGGGDLDIIKIHALIKTGESRGGIRGKFKDYIQRRVIPSFFLSAKVNCKLRFNTRLTGKFNRDYSTISASYFLFLYETNIFDYY